MCVEGMRLYPCFVDLEKASDKFVRKCLGDFEGSEASVKLNNKERESFRVNIVLRQSCVMFQ